MAVNLGELARFIGHDAPLVQRVKASVEWLASTPEGLKVMKDAKLLHGKPIDIIIDAAVHDIGYGNAIKGHVMQANPHLIEAAHYVAEPKGIGGRIGALVRKLTGQKSATIPGTLDRFFCHEFTHAAQPNLLTHAEEYVQRRTQIITQAFEKNALTPQQLEPYVERLKAAVDDEPALRQVLGEIYDRHVAAKAPDMVSQAIARLNRDPLIVRFNKEFETPAIEFENMMMGKYRGEPARLTDYGKSVQYDEIVRTSGRDGFINSGIADIRREIALKAEIEASIAEREAAAQGPKSDSALRRIGGRDPREIRPDAGYKPQGPQELQ